MAFKQNEVEEVRDKLDRAIALHVKQKTVKEAAKLAVDGSDDFSITNNQQVDAYVDSLKQKRDNLIAGIQPTVAAWTPN